ncbi:MAG: HNH endonuclease [Bacillaceae bacterium]|nr:HNH endonuclease [Bacillaceae bacterium]
MPTAVESAWCGKSFNIKPSKVKERNFCTRDCYIKYKAKDQIKTSCFRCGKPVIKSPSNASERSFCSKQCNMKTMNEELNPERMTMPTRLKLRKSKLGKGTKDTYEKTFSQHTHRWVAELKLGRKLKPGEVVHHIDLDKRNNNPSNLMVFPSHKEHLEWHKKHDARYGGDANHV